MQNAIETHHLEKCFGSFMAVQDLNLCIPQGEIFAFLGPNGAGKTTTIKMLTGLLTPTRGEILIAGLNPGQNSMEVKKRIGYIPDQPFVYEKLTVYEFMVILGKLYEMQEPVLHQKIAQNLALFELDVFRDRLVETLSHGMRKRLVFAATLLHEPSILLIDEPMVGLDPKSSKKFKETLVLLKSQGITIFLSTHVLSVAEELADHIAIIHKGCLVACGTLGELKNRGRNAKDLEAAFLAITEDEEA